MPRLTVYDKRNIAHAVGQLHAKRIASDRAKAIVREWSVGYMPQPLRAAVHAGYGECFATTGEYVDGLYFYVYKGVDASKLAADKLLVKRLRATYPVRLRNHRASIVADSRIRARIDRCSTHASCLKQYPELRPFFEAYESRTQVPAHTVPALRRKLLKAGWPLNLDTAP